MCIILFIKKFRKKIILIFIFLIVIHFEIKKENFSFTHFRDSYYKPILLKKIKQIFIPTFM